jgi:alkylated DNA repair dioxygenase AlkB
MSCKFQDVNEKDEEGNMKEPPKHIAQAFAYDQLPVFDWSESKTISHIKELTEARFGVKFDYVLVHLYRDGNDMINYHADKEAMHTPIASISLGATRKFRFRRKNQTSGFEKEYHLKSGALVLMKTGCQQEYIHGVPQEKKVTMPRINLTLRKFE